MIHGIFNLLNSMGSEWVLVVLFILSIVTVWVVLERWFELKRIALSSERFWEEKGEAWFIEANRSVWKKGVIDLKASYPCLETELLEVLHRSHATSDNGGEKLMAAFLNNRRLKLEKLVGILGTIGANAPFIGLLGTVLGIIRAFYELSFRGMGVDSVMSSIAEALVATAIGLMVAVPAVVFFNILSKRIGNLIRKAENLGLFVLSSDKE